MTAGLGAATPHAPAPEASRTTGRPGGGGRAYEVRCAECSATAALPAYRCFECGGPLVLEPAPVGPDDLREDGSRTGVWRRSGILPRTAHAVTLGEADTPLLPLAGVLGDRARVHAKVEAQNPTLSFKDRAMALASSVALDLGLPGLVLASTGNAAVSAAAYAAAAGLPCRVLCGTGSKAALKLAAAAAHGADVSLVEGDYSSAYAQAVRAEDDAWFNVTTTYRNPVLAEAYRALAVEILDDLGHVPDVVVVPIGAGPLLRGLLGGFQDAVSGGAVAGSPRLVGVQASACAPLARAWRHGDWAASLALPSPVLPTRAGAIADSLRGYEREGLLTLQAVRESQGTVVAVDEEQMTRATTALARRGLLVEPAAAAALAALADDEVAGLVPDDGDVVIVLTGHGAKEPLASAVPAPAGGGVDR